MDLDQALVQKIINLLEAIRLRPYMYMLGIQHRSNPAVNWVAGFEGAFHLLGLSTDPAGVFREVIAERGYDTETAMGPTYEIEHSGMSEEEMIKELISIEIEVWKRALAKMKETGEQE